MQLFGPPCSPLSAPPLRCCSTCWIVEPSCPLVSGPGQWSRSRATA